VWYRQNILLFARGRGFVGAQARLDLVHPELWRDPGQILRMVPAALATLARGKLGNRQPGSPGRHGTVGL
jgi:hypothetical protein